MRPCFPTASPVPRLALAVMTSVVPKRILEHNGNWGTLARHSQSSSTRRKTMSVRRYVGAALVTARRQLCLSAHRWPSRIQWPPIPAIRSGCPLGLAGYAITTRLLGQSRRTGRWRR